MSPVLLLVLLLQVADADPLAAARDAFSHGDYAAAASLALAEAQPPVEGAARYLAGLARFRAGHPAEALEQLEAAARTADPPPGPDWQFNRGACLYELGRFEEAERAFVEAADGSSRLAGIALANAGFAALDAGDAERAGVLAERARGLGDAAARPLLDDLDAQLARDRGRRLIADSTAAVNRGDRVEGRRLALAALAEKLDATDATRARVLADVTSPGLVSRGTGWGLSLRLGAGYDTNVLQSGLRNGPEYIPIATGQVSSAALLGTVAGSYRTRPAERLFLEAGYAFEQAAYLAGAAEDYSLQMHSFAVAAEWSVTEEFRTGVGALGQLTFTGLSAFRALQSAAGGLAWAALDESAATTTRVDVAGTGKWGSGSEFDYLTGTRLDLGITQQLRIRGAAVELGYRYRDEEIGTLTTSSTALLRIQGCATTPCPVEYTEPFAYRRPSVLLGARAPLGANVQVGALTGFEWRSYRGDNVLTATVPGMMMSTPSMIEVYRQQREDRRFFAVLFASWRIGPWLSLAARYDLIVNSSTIQSTYDDRNYTKQVATLETVFAW